MSAMPDAGSLLLVMLGDEPVEQPEAEGGGALRDGRGVLLRPGDPGDVEMRPGHVVDEALQELRADAAPAAAIASDILYVGGIAVDRPVEALGERQGPQLLAHPLGAASTGTDTAS